MSIELSNADHPCRQLAIRMMEDIVDITHRDFRRSDWLVVEDILTKRINEFQIKEGKAT
jgi:hypothetical protein